MARFPYSDHNDARDKTHGAVTERSGTPYNPWFNAESLWCLRMGLLEAADDGARGR